MGQGEMASIRAEGDVGHTIPGVAEGHDFGQIRRLQQLAVPIGKAHCQELPIGRKLKDVGHELLKDLHQVQRPGYGSKMKHQETDRRFSHRPLSHLPGQAILVLPYFDNTAGPGVVVPHVQEPGVSTHCYQGQLRMATKSVHGRVKPLQYQATPPILGRELIEELGLDHHHQSGAGAHQEVGALEIILHSHAHAARWLVLIFAGPLEGDGLHGAGQEVLEPGLHSELVVVEADGAVGCADHHARRLLMDLQNIQRHVRAELDDLHRSPLIRAAQTIYDERQVPDDHITVDGARGRLGRLWQEDGLRVVPDALLEVPRSQCGRIELEGLLNVPGPEKHPALAVRGDFVSVPRVEQNTGLHILRAHCSADGAIVVRWPIPHRDGLEILLALFLAFPVCAALVG